MDKVISSATKIMRHRIVELITPTLYMNSLKFSKLLSKSPRPMIEFIKENFYHDFIGVEIGVKLGVNAKSILDFLDIKHLYLIDPYETHPEFFEITKNLLKEYDDKITHILKKSENAINKIPNDLDFVYIDADHSKEMVIQDIKLYYPKVRKGGIIGGHDFGNLESVTETVLDWVKTKNLRLYKSVPDWWVKK